MLQKLLSAGILACFMSVSWAADGSRPSVPEPLRALIRQVLADNPAILAAQAAVAAASAHADAAGQALYNPTLSIATQRGLASEKVAGVDTTTVGINQTVDWSGKRTSRRNTALQQLQAARAELAAVQLRVTAETLSALADYQTAKEQEALSAYRSRLMREFAETATRRHATGDVSRLDEALAQVAYNEALMQQTHATTTLTDSEAALSAASGLPRREAWPSFPERLTPPPENADLDTLVDRIPEIQASLARAAAAREGIDAAKRQRRPDPTLSLWGGRDGSDPLIGVGIEIPLFVRNPFRAEVAAAESESMQAEQNVNEIRRRAHAQLEGTLTHYRSTAAAWQTWQSQGLPRFDEQMTLLERLWHSGELSATDFLVQTKQGVDTQASAAALRGELRRAAVAWLQSSGLLEDWLGVSFQPTASQP